MTGWRVALSPRWLLMHAFTMLVFLACLRLAWWQVSRLEDGGGLQNVGYALQWPAFGCFGVVLWWKMLALARRPTQSAEPQNAPMLSGADALAARPREAADGVDDELAAYNRYLVWLHELESAP